MTKATHHLTYIKQTGFTLIELVLVLVLIGVLGAVVVPRLSISNQFQDRLQADNLIGLLRQAQLRAMNDPRAVTEHDELARCAKVFIDANGFSIAQGCSTGLVDKATIKEAASQGQFVGATELDIKVDNNSSAGMVLQFGQATTDSAHKNFLTEASLLGRPFINGEPLKETLTITLGGKDIYLEPEGYIHGP